MLVIDDHELFSTTLTMALRAEGFAARAAVVGHVRDDLDLAAGTRGGLAVLDLDLGRDDQGRYLSGTDLIDDLRARAWSVLVVSGSADAPGVAAAVAAGAVGSVPKSASFSELLRTVVAAADGETVMSPDEHDRWLAVDRRYRQQERELSRRLARLSPREREVLELLAEGRRAAAIAEHFVVSMPTVRTQIRSILTKLETSSQLEAVALLRRPPDGHARPA